MRPIDLSDIPESDDEQIQVARDRRDSQRITTNALPREQVTRDPRGNVLDRMDRVWLRTNTTRIECKYPSGGHLYSIVRSAVTGWPGRASPRTALKRTTDGRVNTPFLVCE